MTSSFVNYPKVNSSICVMSQPINSGEASKHQRLMCVYCSLEVSFVGRKCPHPGGQTEESQSKNGGINTRSDHKLQCPIGNWNRNQFAG
jgi:hypothetical protein